MSVLFSTAWAQPDSLLNKITHSTGLQKAKAYNDLAGYYRLTNPDTTILLARKALQLNTAYNDQSLEASCRGKIAEAYSSLAQYDSSLVYYMQGIRISEKLGDESKMSSYYNGIGTVLYGMGDYEKAIAYMKQAAQLQLKLGNTVYYATISCNVAAAMMMMNQSEEGIALLKEAEQHLKKSGDIGILALLYNNMGGNFQHGLKNIDSAEYYYNKSISMPIAPGEEMYKMAAYRNIGEIYLEKKDYARAGQNFRLALELSLQLERRSERVGIYGSLSDLYAATGQYREAYEYKKRQAALYDSLFNEEKESTIHRLEMQYQTEKKDLRIKEQDLLLQKEQNKRNKILFLSVICVIVLLTISLYFWQKKRSKEELEKAKSRIFQNIVHEIKTPLTLITGPLNLLRKDVENQANRQQFEAIEQNAEKLVSLVNELLLTSKLEKGELQIGYTVGDIVLFTQQLVENFRPMANEHQVDLQYHAPQEQELVSFGAVAYEKIVSNLVSNAIKYNRPGGYVKVQLQVNEQQWILTVSDNGVGMSSREKEKMFQRFYRSEEQKNKPGFGIGLSVVAELIHQLKGHINVETAPQVGTTIQVTLPKQPAPAPLPETGSEPTGEWVLVVEDDPGIYAFIKEILDRAQIPSQRAGNGARGFEMACQHLPELVITDVMMPVEDGLSMTIRLKANELTRHIPVLMLSARAALNSRLQGMQSGADVYLAKPFHPDELLLQVTNIQNTLRLQRSRFVIDLQQPGKTYRERLGGKDEYLKKIVEAVDQHILDTDFSVNELADIMCISRSQLHRKITALTGFSTTQFIRIVRLEKAKDLLETNAGNVTEIAYQCGFSSQSYFTKSFSEHFGKAPSELLK